ncbi:death domain-associated protein 6 isoform X1 [Xiphophorus hellerii]|uniref:death domain-associated protein 6 isoform X1 n=1 Tax=Xiphophorus hellerii TaxID=8084 RepID=UPI0013B3A676|nr:death domain-associated protein 6-like isoform X1 [Xiphophorus hellerii]
MAVAPASMADKIIVLDDDDDNTDIEQRPQPSSSELRAKNVSPPKNQHLVQTHIAPSPFSLAKKSTKALQVQNQKLFDEFVQHCTPLTNECPEVLTFLQTKHSKACPDYLCSVEFRNSLGQCLTRAQGNVGKTFVYINELCTMLKQHSVKKRQTLSKVEPSASESGSHQSTSASLKSKDKRKGGTGEEEDGVQSEEKEQPTTSGDPGETREENPEADRKARRALRKQIAYLENLLKLYNDEIYRLQQVELSLDDMETENSTYIQEHKLKRKMMKIYEKLCELKGCGSLTGRVIEQRIRYTGTRYPEINKRIERFINSPGTHNKPPNYSDILHQVVRANKRHGLCLNAEQREEVAREAFTETGKRVQERRHLDLVYNFGSRLTDTYKPATDPALMDPALLKKLRSNRVVALSRLEEVINKYAVEQDMVDKEKLRMDKENQKVGEKSKTKQTNGVAQDEEDEEEDEDEDESSDPDIEDEIEASTQQHGADDDDDNEEDNDNEADEAGDDADNKEDQTLEETGSTKDEDDPASDETQISPMSDVRSPRDSPSQSESMQTDEQLPSSNGSPAAPRQSEDSSNQVSGVAVADEPTDLPSSPAAAVTNGNPSPEQKTVSVEQSNTQTTNGTTPVPSPRTTRSLKRKREEVMSSNSRSTKQKMSYDSNADIPLDMGVICCGSPQKEESSVLDTLTKNPTVSVQSTPPPKKNKVNVATQCDPDEIIVLSDSD